MITNVNDRIESKTNDVGRSYCFYDGSTDLLTFFQLALLSNESMTQECLTTINKPSDRDRDQCLLSGYLASDTGQYQKLNFLLFARPIRIEGQTTTKRLQQEIGDTQVKEAKIDYVDLPNLLEIVVNEIDATSITIILCNLGYRPIPDTAEIPGFKNTIKRHFSAMKPKLTMEPSLVERGRRKWSKRVEKVPQSITQGLGALRRLFTERPQADTEAQVDDDESSYEFDNKSELKTQTSTKIRRERNEEADCLYDRSTSASTKFGFLNRWGFRNSGTIEAHKESIEEIRQSIADIIKEQDHHFTQQTIVIYD